MVASALEDGDCSAKLLPGEAAERSRGPKNSNWAVAAKSAIDSSAVAVERNAELEMQGRKADAEKGLAQTPVSYWLIRGGCSKQLVRLDRSLAPQLRDSIFIDCCDKTKSVGR